MAAAEIGSEACLRPGLVVKPPTRSGRLPCAKRQGGIGDELDRLRRTGRRRGFHSDTHHDQITGLYRIVDVPSDSLRPVIRPWICDGENCSCLWDQRESIYRVGSCPAQKYLYVGNEIHRW